MSKHADEDREYLRAGFGRIHQRLDEQAEELSSIKFAVQTGAKIDAQVRTELNKVSTDIEPLVSRAKTMRWALGVIAGAFVASGITITVAADAVRGAVRQWLGL